MPTTRRNLIKAALAVPATALAGKPGSAVPDSLAGIAAAAGIRFGAAVRRQQLADASYLAVAAFECAVIVCENEMKWRMLRRGSDGYDFAPADAIVRFAARHGMKMRGHALLFHRALDAAWDEAARRHGASGAVEEHIRTVVAHFPDLISWDVVNEPLDPKSRRSDLLREDKFLAGIGDSYIARAFEIAREAAPRADLCLNDTVAPYAAGYFARHRAASLKLFERLLARKIPVTTAGLQSHLVARRDDFDETGWSSYLRELRGMGLKLALTELDAIDQDLPPDIAARDATVADRVRQYLDVTLASGAVTDLLTWGLVDRYSHVQKARPRSDGLPSRPLPYDDAYEAKPMRQAIAGALRSAPRP